MKRRLPFALALVLALGGTVLALVFLIRDERAPVLGLPVGEDGIAARAGVAPRSQHFGDPVVAHLELLVDREVLDPELITVDAKFDPFTQGGEIRRARTDYDRFTRLRFDYPLDCLTSGCVPDLMTKDFTFRRAAVRHEGVPVEMVSWPTLTIVSRVDEIKLARAAQDNPGAQPGSNIPWRANVRVQPLTYSVDPTVLTALFVGFALLLLAASLYLVQHAFPSAPLGFRRRRKLKLTPLERALIVLERAQERGIEREQRLALDRLAHELRSGGRTDLAGAARQLAWEQDVPGADRTATLSERVRELIAGRTNGRS